MTNKDYDKLKQIEEAIQAFSSEKLYESSLALLKALDYQSNKTARLSPTSFEGFLDAFGIGKNAINKQKALTDDWKQVEFIFQIDDEEINKSKTKQASFEFEKPKYNGNEYNSFIFFTIHLKEESYKRSDLVKITREINLPFKMPVIVLFHYGNKLTLSIIDRRLHKKVTSKDVLEKVTLIKDIDIASPQRAHKEILKDLSLNELYKKFEFHSFVKLHEAWKATLNISELNKRFYEEIFNWYLWASKWVKFPQIRPSEDMIPDEVHQSESLIRLLTRLLFCWFMKEKGLIHEALFNERIIQKILKSTATELTTYYTAILQNLFFATLNQPIEKRKTLDPGWNKAEYGDPLVYRHQELFNEPQNMLTWFKDIPFLNGGLFDCLDQKKDAKHPQEIRLDGFSSKKHKQPLVPNKLFFGEYSNIDLSQDYSNKKKTNIKIRGIIDILSSYKFTVEENTPVEEEIALDPELLGKVFENLLASYNPETQTTARKQTGSFYTPREIVNYMVDESLLEYLKSTVSIPADDMSFFNPNDEIEIYQGNLPHWQQKEVWYFVTFRLADSIPSEVAEQIKVERELWMKKNAKDKNGNYSKAQIKEYNRLFSDRIETLLNDCRGSCLLKGPDVAKTVANALLHFNKKRYELDAWVIMPNHVHVLVKPLGDNKLDEILHSWKSYTANEINKVLGRKGQLWMHESYDHIVRNEKAFQAIRNYILQNPIKAHLKEGEFLLQGSVSNPADEKETISIPADENITRSKDASDTFEARLRDLFSYSENPNPFNEAETQALIEALHNCKILDPACGSGAFPMGILHKMVHLLQKLDPDNKFWKDLQRKKAIEETEAAFNIGDKEERAKKLAEINDVFENNTSDYGRKLYLIENCIYGIDIQPIAIQISKLRFFISLLVDQKEKPDKPNRGFAPLPNLDFKLVAANTLIAPPESETAGFGLFKNQEDSFIADLQRLTSRYFNTHFPDKKKIIREQIEHLIDKEVKQKIKETESRYKHENQQIEKALQQKNKALIEQKQFDINLWKSYTKLFKHETVGFFDIPYFFPKVGSGFDIVIGNPPYIQLQKDSGRLANELQHKGFKTFERTGDIYTLFYEKGIQLLKNNGILTYITSNKWMRAAYGKSTRAFFCQHNPLSLIDLGSGIFESATVDTNILIIQKTNAKPASYQLKALDIAKEKNITSFEQFADRWTTLTQLSDEAWTIASDIEQRIKQKIEQKGKPLKEWDINIYRGILTGYNEAFIIDGKKKDELIAQDPKSAEIIKPILRGRDIKRYKAEFADLWLIATHNGIKDKGIPRINVEKDYPAIYEHLKQYEPQLQKRQDKGDHWTNLRNCAYYQEFEKEKIVWNRIASVKEFSLVEKGILIQDSMHFIVGKNLYFIIGILNSTLFSWLLNLIVGTAAGGNAGNADNVKNIPIPKLSESDQQPFVALVEQILAGKEQGKNTTALEQQIDQLVYGLYGLTEDEIAIIENSTN